MSQVNLGTIDAIEVCPEPKSRGAVHLGFPRDGLAILANLPKVSDVKERSEERLLGRSPVSPGRRAWTLCMSRANEPTWEPSSVQYPWVARFWSRSPGAGRPRPRAFDFPR